ncbi:MAG: type II secretion system GspH family protein [Heliobacteriaceae bacterium]|jgi:prepilin-type N-terminal cleavage/methylation domain-containing protein|nr:type II secretion system GspH family protein [Heliobacteriaceae bacterium]
MKKTGFTLAEILITLGIIGVVAALTMPSLITNHKKKTTIVKLRREYSVLTNAFERAQADNGDIAEWDWSLNVSDFFRTYLKPYLLLSKDCGTGNNTCWLPYNAIYRPDGTKYLNTTGGAIYTAILNDGTYISVEKQDNNHVHMYIDIDGRTGNSMFGRDVFELTMTKEKFTEEMHIIEHSGLHLYGHGLSRDNLINNTYGCDKTKAGAMCGALYQYDDWQISDDVNVFK